MDEEKGGYILAEAMWALIEIALFGYFFFFCRTWEDTYYAKDEPEEEKPEEKREEEKKDEEKKEDKKEQ